MIWCGRRQESSDNITEMCHGLKKAEVGQKKIVACDDASRAFIQEGETINVL